MSPRSAIAKGKAAALRMETAGHTLIGCINVYACTPPGSSLEGGCGYWIVTRDVDTGVTPMFVRCGHCSGMATSRMYKVGDGLRPTHEWFRPATEREIPSAYRNAGALDHIANGGLILRPIGKDEWLAPTPETRAFIEEEQAMFSQLRAGGRR